MRHYKILTKRNRCLSWLKTRFSRCSRTSSPPPVSSRPAFDYSNTVNLLHFSSIVLHNSPSISGYQRERNTINFLNFPRNCNFNPWLYLTWFARSLIAKIYQTGRITLLNFVPSLAPKLNFEAKNKINVNGYRWGTILHNCGYQNVYIRRE